ncbi:MAG TPA: hypothetical protein DCL54_10710 [Alphaproteobacteria bacterium]|nr:hypothetical protein [Alphaproteobacteria bacterium]HAJ47039.1 hypothetical protein [Alphaproteobacteria bacterium]
MPQLTIEVSEEAQIWINALINDGAFASAGAYVEQLIRWQKEDLDRLLQAGRDSGRSPRSFDDIFESAKARHLARAADEPV